MGKGAGTALESGSSSTPYGAIASAGIGAGLGIYNIIKGSKEKRDAQKALENYQRQPLNNAYDNIQVSTRGADLQREEQARLASEQVGALQGAGTRALVGGLGRVETGNQRVNLGIGANLDEQQKAIDQMKAEDQARIRMMQENREQNDINALSSQYQAGKQDANMGFGNVIQGFGSLQNQMNFNSALKSQNGLGNNGVGSVVSPIVIPNQGMSMASERFNPMDNPRAFGSSGIPYAGQVNQGASLRPAWMNNIPNTQYF